jgi:hypothetical protein
MIARVWAEIGIQKDIPTDVVKHEMMGFVPEPIEYNFQEMKKREAKYMFRQRIAEFEVKYSRVCKMRFLENRMIELLAGNKNTDQLMFVYNVEKDRTPKGDPKIYCCFCGARPHFDKPLCKACTRIMS